MVLRCWWRGGDGEEVMVEKRPLVRIGYLCVELLVLNLKMMMSHHCWRMKKRMKRVVYSSVFS